MNTRIVTLAFSVLCLLGAFMPIARGGALYVDLTHIGGVTFLLYLLPFAAGSLSLISIYKGDIRYMKVWMVVVALAGLALSGIAITAGKSQIDFMSNSFGNMNSMLQGMAGGDSPVANKETIQSAIGLGGIFLVVGYLGVLVGGLLPAPGKRKMIAAMLALGLLAVGSHAFAEEPRPFGLILGKSSLQETRTVIEREGGKITNEGSRVIDGDMVNPRVTGLEVEGLPVAELENANFWFFNGTLMEVDYRFPGSMDKSEFYRLSDQLKEKYGKPASYRAPNLANGLAVWKSRGVEVRLSVAWVGSVTNVTYLSPALAAKASTDDKRVYAQQTKEKVKGQKGL